MATMDAWYGEKFEKVLEELCDLWLVGFSLPPERGDAVLNHVHHALLNTLKLAAVHFGADWSQADVDLVERDGAYAARAVLRRYEATRLPAPPATR